ncbi:MAG: CotH kinase family protein [Prolixibacteraceae bacterium]|nr:CotH kinase family protein [Prolixibacteraceae bacterium]
MTYRLLFVLQIFLVLSLKNIFAQINFNKGAEYRLLKGISTVDLPENWMADGSVSAGWDVAFAPFRYGDGDGGTELSDMRNYYSTFYLQTKFTAQNIDAISSVNFNISYDDGFVLWINGEEVIRRNAPVSLVPGALSPENHEWNDPLSIDLAVENLPIIEGENLVSIQVFNTTLGSSDAYFDMGIMGNVVQPELPMVDAEGISLTFSHNAGFYANAFELQVTASNDAFGVIYTVDGSNPQTSATAIKAGSVVAVTVDPDSETGRGRTPAFIVRASLWKEGFSPAFPVGNTYIFLDKVPEQSNPGGGWPSGSVNGQRIDYDMAADIVTNSKYSSMMGQALLEIPSISISTDLDNLFGYSQGIYVNASQKGEEWERDCSIELINPSGKEGFSVNAGLRIRGGNSAKNSNNPKHAFRLFFRKEYGEGKLHYPLFDDKGASEFDCFDLRCEQNYSWSMDGDPQNTLIKDIYSRDMQQQMGHLSAKGEYYHLYLNGMYWGIFQTDERPEASFAESYLGGDKEDYDIVKVNTQPWPYYNEVTEGTMDTWEDLWNLCRTGFQTNEQYFNLEGKDKNGKRIHDARVWVDIDNLIDFLLIIFYTGNFDAPVSAWGGNDMPNNFFAIINRENLSQGFKFVAHDSEHCMFVDEKNIDNGIHENRVNIGTTGAMKINRLLDFNPQWLHYRLCQNEEYRLRFADHAYKYLSEGGLFSPDTAHWYFERRALEIDTAIVAESARWGDAQQWGGSLNRDDHWLAELENLYDNYFPYRTDIVIGQLQDENLYPQYNAPRVSAEGTTVVENRHLFSAEVSVTVDRNNPTGDIYFTTNGADPRLPGGTISPDAINGGKSTSFQLTSNTLFKGRVKSGNAWGALNTVLFVKQEQDFSKFKVTELDYHPLDIIDGVDTIDQKNLEFIEFKNTGSEVLDLSGLKLDSAVTFTFPSGTLLFPGHFYVVASKPNSFFRRFGRYPDGNFQGQFGNSGEYVLLTDKNGKEILSFTYSDQLPWPVEADGTGYSLTSVEDDPKGDPNNVAYWKFSSALNGSPFANDDGSTSSDDNPFALKCDVRVYPNPASGFIKVSVKGTENIVVTCFDLQGRLKFKEEILSGEKIDLSPFSLDNGLYILRIFAGDNIFTQKLEFIVI